jgi:hypothetical protein
MHFKLDKLSSSSESISDQCKCSQPIEGKGKNFTYDMNKLRELVKTTLPLHGISFHILIGAFETIPNSVKYNSHSTEVFLQVYFHACMY